MVNIVTAIISTTSVLIIMSAIRKYRMSFYIYYLISIAVLNILLNGNNYTFMLKVICGSIITIAYTKNVTVSIFSVLTAESTIAYFVFFIGPLVYFNPDLLVKYKPVYNLCMSAYVLTVSLIIRKFTTRYIRYFQIASRKIMKLSIIIECTTYLPLCTWAHLLDINFLYLTMLTMLLYTTIIVFLLLYILSLLLKTKEIQREKDIDIQKRLIAWKLHFNGPMMSLMREYIDNNDIKGMRSLYEKFIGPIHKDFEASEELAKLKLIQMPLIAKYLYDVITRTGYIKLMISESVNIRNIPEVDMFLIVSQYVENAMEHLAGHEDGVINIYMVQEMDSAFIKIENTFYESEFDISSIVNPKKKEGHMGFGLEYIREILDRNNIIYSMYVHKNRFVQSIEIEG